MSEQVYELSLTESYVENWKFEDALREIIQNGTDQELVDKSNKFSVRYDEDEEKLLLINEKSKLKINSLLLGKTSKKDDDHTVGHFGEGYKIAALVFNRLGKTFTIYNNAANEKWESRFKNSPKWHEKILAFYISKNETDQNDLVIEIGNVSYNEFQFVYDIWMNYDNPDISKTETEYGDILLDEEYESKVYVNGIFVEENSNFHFGYNFKPEYLKLDRDRKRVDIFDMGRITCRMVLNAIGDGAIDEETLEEICDLDTYDVAFMKNACNFGNITRKESATYDGLSKRLIKDFDEKNGIGAIPVMYQEEADKVKKLGGKPIIVNDFVYKTMGITDSRMHELARKTFSNTMSPLEKLKNWFEIHREELGRAAREELSIIINSME